MRTEETRIMDDALEALKAVKIPSYLSDSRSAFLANIKDAMAIYADDVASAEFDRAEEIEAEYMAEIEELEIEAEENEDNAKIKIRIEKLYAKIDAI